MAAEVITSRENPRIKQLARLLSRRKEREKEDRFVLEGARLCLDAAGSGAALQSVFFTEAALEHYPALHTLEQRAAQSYLISREIAARLSDTQAAQGVFAVCPKLDNSESAVTIKSGGRYVLLSSLQDPGNLGTILRTAEALGADGLYLSADCPDLYSPKVLRGSMGGVLRLPVAIVSEIERAIARLREQGVRVYAAALQGDPVGPAELSRPESCAVLIGNEGNGLPQDQVAACDGAVRIPMAGGAESLNAGAAAAILLWEMNRRKLEVRN